MIRFASPALRPSTQAWLPASMSCLRFAGKSAAAHAQAENNSALVQQITDLARAFAAVDEIKKSFTLRIQPKLKEVFLEFSQADNPLIRPRSLPPQFPPASWDQSAPAPRPWLPLAGWSRTLRHGRGLCVPNRAKCSPHTCACAPHPPCTRPP